jgi:hypothetical protein
MSTYCLAYKPTKQTAQQSTQRATSSCAVIASQRTADVPTKCYTKLATMCTPQ